jgi:hypothetical protein
VTPSSTERPGERGSVWDVNSAGQGLTTRSADAWTSSDRRARSALACRLIAQLAHRGRISAGGPAVCRLSGGERQELAAPRAGGFVIWQGIHSPAETPAIDRYIRGMRGGARTSEAIDLQALLPHPQISPIIRVGEVPGSNPGAPIFPCKSTAFTLRFAVCYSLQKLNGTYHAEGSGAQKCCISVWSTAIVGTTGPIGEVHGLRTGPLARKRPANPHVLTPAVRPPVPVLCPVCAQPRERGQVSRRRATHKSRA